MRGGNSISCNSGLQSFESVLLFLCCCSVALLLLQRLEGPCLCSSDPLCSVQHHGGLSVYLSTNLPGLKYNMAHNPTRRISRGELFDPFPSASITTELSASQRYGFPFEKKSSNYKRMNEDLSSKFPPVSLQYRASFYLVVSLQKMVVLNEIQKAEIVLQVEHVVFQPLLLSIDR